jgi:16S rRNA (cytosine967-C5)-methyltransferase
MKTLEERPAPSARNVAFAVVRDVFGPQQRGAVEALDHHLRRADLSPRDRAFVTELAYGTIEQRRWLDYQLAPYLGAKAAKLPAAIAEILRLGTYQLRAMRVHAYAAVSESVQLARRYGHPGTAGLVNAVLRRIADEPERVPDEVEDPDDRLGIVHSLPTWLVRSWRARFGAAQLDAILEGVNEPAAMALSVDTRRASLDDVGARLRAHDIASHPSPFARDTLVLDAPVPNAVAFAAIGDDAQVHGEAAAFPVDLLDPQPGESILDACSGRGNKTLQIVAAMRGQGHIVALDDDAKRGAEARRRLGETVEVRVADATELDPSERYDAVVVDAPCSGLGIVGRQPEARWRKSPDDPARLAPLQRAILDAAAATVRPGGRLVYAVCSTDEREAEGIIEPFLDATPSFARAPLPERYAPFATAAGDVLVAPGIDGRDGFYVALLHRT